MTEHLSAAFDFEPTVETLRKKQAVKWHSVGADVLPAFIAETDFNLCPAVVEAIGDLLERGDVGYPDWSIEPLAEAFASRMDVRYGWQPEQGHVRHVCDLIQAVQIVIELATAPGGAVALHYPNYPPFVRAVPAMGRRAVGCPLEAVGDPPGGSWAFDPERLEAAIRVAGATVLLVVNPHNPTGRVFRRDELAAMAEIACKYDMVVISDELHAELTYDHARHIPLASLGDDIAQRTVTITSATKSFNLGGLRCAVAHVGDARVRRAWDRLPTEYFGSLNVVGVEATLAAWRSGDSWLEAQRRHLTAMRNHLSARVCELPGITLRPPEATFLAWLDCSSAQLDEDPAAFFHSRTNVVLVPGPDFGPGGQGYARLNFGTSRMILDEMIDRMATSLR